jgi:hypothetical protein
MKRRRLLQLLLGTLAALPAKVRLFAQSSPLTGLDETRLNAMADIVLPSELGADGRSRVVEAFLRWLRDYRPDADLGHGYGFTRLRRGGPSPSANYHAQLEALEQAIEENGRDRRVAIETAIQKSKVERLPARPDGGHVATDLMAFYFSSEEANDLAYRAAIRRESCRGLDGSQNRPGPLAERGR